MSAREAVSPQSRLGSEEVWDMQTLSSNGHWGTCRKTCNRWRFRAMGRSLKPRIMQEWEQLLEKQQVLLKASKGTRFSPWLPWLWSASYHWANVLSKSQCWLKEWTQQIFLASPLSPPIYVLDDQKQLNSSCAFTSTRYEMLQWKLTWGFPLGYKNIKTFCGKMLF